MAGTTIFSSTTVGVTLTIASQNPVTVKSTGTVNVSGTGASAIYGVFGVPGTIANDGLLTAADGYGIKLVSGGTIMNGSATDTKASISGGLYGVRFNIHGAGTLHNFGTISNTSTTTGAGVRALGGGTVVNGSAADTVASISGYFDGVRIAGPGASVVNFGKIAATGTSTTVGFGSFGIYFQTGGTVTNGSATDTKASITGVTWGVEIEQAPGTIANFGTIRGTGTLGRGIVLGAGGSVTNGSAADTAAYIAAADRNGIYIGGITSSTVSNFGTIKSLDTITGSSGVAIRTGGTVTNGTATDTKAVISGGNHGVYIEGALPSAVINFGTIASLLGSSISLYLGGNVTNGSAGDTAAQITGRSGISAGGPSTVTNFGTITGIVTNGVYTADGGTIINGSATDTTALIASTGTTASHSGIYNRTNQATITNFGTIKSPTASAIHLNDGGTIVNGSTADTTALIVGSTSGSSVYLQGTQVAISNFATIGSSLLGVSGIFLGQGGSITNGSAADTKASIIGGSGTVGSGIFVNSGTALVNNFGTISGGGSGVNFGSNGTVSSTGTVVNGSTADTAALIVGSFNGISAGNSITVSNFATIKATTSTGVFLGQGGSVTNGSAADTKAAIAGGTGEGIIVNAGTVGINNFGTIAGANGIGFGNGASVATVVNGSAADTSALIIGNNGTFGNGVGGGSSAIGISNFGTIAGSTGIGIGNGTVGAKGTVVNGSTADTAALITGGTSTGTVGNGIAINSATVSISNFGTVNGAGSGASGIFVNSSTVSISNFGTVSSGGNGINFGANGSVASAGTVVNGSAADTSALIIGNNGTFGTGVFVGSGTTGINNFGTIKGISTGIGFGANGTVATSGTVVNGSAADTHALITGGTGTVGTGMFISSSTVSVSNFGTVNGAGTGINFSTNGSVASAGTVVNGSTADTSALIVGSSNGIFASNSITVSNFAAIKATTFAGVFLGQGGSVTNGSAADTKAVISSTGTTGVGVFVSAGQATVTNFGTITSAGNSAIVFSTGTGTVVNAGSIKTAAGAAGTAIQFGSGAERLVLRPGSSITGKVFGGSGTNTLELASGGSATTGSIGSQFTNFGTVVVDAGANWTLTGVNNTATVTNNGTLSVAAGGTLQVTGAVNPASTGIFQLNNTSILELSADKGASNQMKFLGAGEVIVDQATDFGINVGTTTYTGPLIESFVANDKIDLKDVAFNNAILNYSTATGLLQVTSGGAGVATLAFQNSSLGAGAFHPNDDGTGHLLITHS